MPAREYTNAQRLEFMELASRGVSARAAAAKVGVHPDACFIFGVAGALLSAYSDGGRGPVRAAARCLGPSATEAATAFSDTGPRPARLHHRRRIIESW